MSYPLLGAWHRQTGIGQIYPTNDCPTFYECKDGTYSTFDGRGACSRHGGLMTNYLGYFDKIPFIGWKVIGENQTGQFEKPQWLFSIDGKKPFLSRSYPERWRSALTKRGFNVTPTTHTDFAKGYWYILLEDSPKKYKRYTKKLFTPIGAIVSKRTVFIPCNDGSFSTASKYPCTTRGGVNSSDNAPTFQSGSTPYSCADTFMIPLSKIHTNERLFQNREDAYSRESVARIIAAVKDGSFKWQVFDPVLLWESPSGKLYILSGHSRTEAFRQLAKMKLKAGRRGFGRIPAKIIKVPEAEAVQIALMSNTLSSPETPLERATYYRNLLQNNVAFKEVEKLARMYEGKAARQILNYALLSPRGKTYAALKNLQTAQPDSRRAMERIGNWIGQSRQMFPFLTTAHENELYDYLTHKASSKITTYREFSALLHKAIERKTTFGQFAIDEPLNLNRFIYKSDAQQEYDRMLQAAKREVEKMQRIRDEKFNKWVKDGHSLDTIKPAIKKYDDTVTAARRKYAELLSKRSKVNEADKRQAALFGIPYHRSHSRKALVAFY